MLFLTGAAMVICAILSFFVVLLWIGGIPLGIIGVYLLVWSTLGKGRWCRTCKKFFV